MVFFQKKKKAGYLAGYEQPRRKYWKFIIRTRVEERYRDKCRRLDAAGIDYRVWMNENEPNLVYLREYLGNLENLRRHYIFFVRRAQFEEACRVLDIDPKEKLEKSVIYF